MSIHTPEYLRILRLAELDLTLDKLGDYFRDKDLLEIGSGFGDQLRHLSTVCRSVAGVDIPGSIYSEERRGPIVDYDGTHLPFPDDTFDIVYSSNVLEHVRDLGCVLTELRRVIRPGGVGVHLMPSPAWRRWSLLTHYPALPSIVRSFHQRREKANRTGMRSPKRSVALLLANVLIAPRHGEFGNRFTEARNFRAEAWHARFTASRWRVITSFPTGLFYTGGILNRRLSMAVRGRTARYFGSACLTYVVTPA